MSDLSKTLSKPTRLQSIPEHAQWLAGEGAGSWFIIQKLLPHYEITRLNPEGNIECSGLFRIISHHLFLIEKPYQFVHLSHCQKVHIQQEQNLVVFERI